MSKTSCSNANACIVAGAGNFPPSPKNLNLRDFNLLRNRRWGTWAERKRKGVGDWAWLGDRRVHESQCPSGQGTEHHDRLHSENAWPRGKLKLEFIFAANGFLLLAKQRASTWVSWDPNHGYLVMWSRIVLKDIWFALRTQVSSLRLACQGSLWILSSSKIIKNEELQSYAMLSKKIKQSILHRYQPFPSKIWLPHAKIYIVRIFEKLVSTSSQLPVGV